MYPIIRKKKSKFKIKFLNYVYELKNSLYGLLKMMSSFHNFLLSMKKGFHF